MKILSNTKGSGMDIILFGFVLYLLLVLSVSGILHNSIIISQQIRVRHSIESASRAAMLEVDVLNIDALEMISKGVGTGRGTNFITLNKANSINTFLYVFALGVNKHIEDIKDNVLIAFIEPHGENQYEVTIKLNGITQHSVMNALTDVELEINNKLGQHSTEAFLSGSQMYEAIDHSLFAQDIVDSRRDNSFIVAHVFNYELDGVFPILDLDEGVVNEQQFSTSVVGVVNHIRTWED